MERSGAASERPSGAHENYPGTRAGNQKNSGCIRIEANLSPKLHRIEQRAKPGPENPRTDQNGQTAIHSALFKYDYLSRCIRKRKIAERTELKSNLAANSESYTPIMTSLHHKDPNISTGNHESSMGVQTKTKLSLKRQRIKLRQAPYPSNGQARSHEDNYRRSAMR
jgi:hypothetical protein